MDRNDRNKAITAMTKASKTTRELVDDLLIIRDTPNINPNEKYYKMEFLLDEYEEVNKSTNQSLLKRLEEQLLRQANNDNFYEEMSKLSRQVQLRLSGVLKALVFSDTNENSELLEAVHYFQHFDGMVSDDAPTEFLTTPELNYLMRDGKLNISLYKYLLFVHVADGIKSGSINQQFSFEYRSVQDYLISPSEWEASKENLIGLAGLTDFIDVDRVLEQHKVELDQKYHEINKALLKNENPHLNLSIKDRIQISTPKTDYDTSGFISKLLQQRGIVSIQKVISDINQITSFGDSFVHHSNKHIKSKPSVTELTAGILGLGCNIGIDKLAKISQGVREHTLKNTVNWYFDLKNVRDANDRVVKLINSLGLSNSFGRSNDVIYSSGDGRKLGVATDSLTARRSFKYFGKDEGAVMYSFIDHRHSLYYITVISANEREAPYVLDSLAHNDIEQPVMHSTDEHGFSEATHAAAHLFGVSFAPRFKQIGTKRLWGFSSKSSYKKKGFKILPSSTINQKKIRQQWDNILRFMATIKLNRAPASYLFSRLNSYSKKNPLYRGLQEYGRIIKSIYILTYCNDLELRQDVHKSLGRIELSNKFSKAVFFDNEQEFQVGDPESQKLATACKGLIMNCIVLWNCLSLSEMILDTLQEERDEFVEAVLKGSLYCWRHVNMRGSYNFRRLAANEPRFDIERIRTLKVA